MSAPLQGATGVGPMPEPIAFMVMPFNVKETGGTGPDVPLKVDFDALWDRVYQPVLAELGYRPVRADRDVGALIISEMIQRLTLADLVVADVSIPNANVYYEVGVRHAARDVGCVLVAADWAKPVFDLAQMRQVRYPLTDGGIGDAAVAAATAKLRVELDKPTTGTSPVFAAVPGYPADIKMDRVSAFEDVVAELSEFDAEVRAVRFLPPDERPAAARAVRDRHGGKRVVREAVVLALVRLLRDYAGWQETLDYIDILPSNVARHPLVVEQRCLALGKVGRAATATARLEELIRLHGPSSERLGLLGGRYKELWRAASKPADTSFYLDRMIDAYERGTNVDLNRYYPPSNLPRLYRKRGADGDQKRAHRAEVLVAAACERAIALGIADEWIDATLLGLAFDAGDLAEARQLQQKVERAGGVDWMNESTIRDLEITMENQHDEGVRQELDAILTSLRRLVKAPTPSPETGEPSP
jgi:hypothetical protein